jgi:putative Holliday junction resolvase
MIIALDYGEKNIGVAVTDEDEIFAFPKCNIPTHIFKKNIRILETELADFSTVTDIIIGLPKNLKGENTPQTEKTLQFYELISNLYSENINVALYDERFTSTIFQKTYQSMGGKMKDARATKDMYEAAILLEDYLKRKMNER